MTEPAKPKSAGKFVSLVDALGYTDELGDGTVKYAGHGKEVELSEAEHKRLMDSANFVDTFPPIAKAGSKAAAVLGNPDKRFDPLDLVPMTPGQSVSMDTVNNVARQYLQELHGEKVSAAVSDPAGEPVDEVKSGSEAPAADVKDYSGLNKKQLSAEAKSRGIEVPQKTKNDEIVKLLQADDAGASENDEGVTPRVGAEHSATYA